MPSHPHSPSRTHTIGQGPGFFSRFRPGLQGPGPSGQAPEVSKPPPPWSTIFPLHRRGRRSKNSQFLILVKPWSAGSRKRLTRSSFLCPVFRLGSIFLFLLPVLEPLFVSSPSIFPSGSSSLELPISTWLAHPVTPPFRSALQQRKPTKRPRRPFLDRPTCLSFYLVQDPI